MPDMQAAFVERLGPADGIRIGRLPVPEPAPGQVLVAVEAVAVDMVDTYVRAGTYKTDVPLPYILGRDLVGTVSAAPSGSPWRVGDRVWANSLGHDGRQGVSAEFAAVAAERLYPMPPDATAHTILALAHAGATAHLGWFAHAALRAGETVFVGGGGGNVGLPAVAFAADAGARVIASAAAADADRVRRAGAAVVFDYRDAELSDRLAQAAPDGVDVFWETSGHHDGGLLARVLAPGARVLLTAVAGPALLPLPQLYTRDVSLLGFVISRAAVADLARAAAAVNGAAARLAPLLRPPTVLPLGSAREAHELMESGGVRGRLILEIPAR